MLRLIIAVATASLFAATSASAADWQPADLSAEVMVGIDVDSIRSGDGFGAGVVIYAFAAPREGADYMISGVGIDCAKHTITLLGEALYKADGTEISANDDEGEEDPIEPDSLAQALEEMVCQGRRDPANISDPVQFAAAARVMLLEKAAR